MATTAAPRKGMSDEELADIIALMKNSDDVEIKLTLPENTLLSTGRKLGLDPLNAQIRQVFFFDTPDLQLNKAGVVVRARRTQGRADESTIKLRPVVPEELSAKLRRMPTFKVEVDAMPGGHVCSGSLGAELGLLDVRSVHLNGKAVRKLFSPEQRAFYKEHAPEGLELDDLTLFGPIFVLKLKSNPEGFNRRLTTELWMYPDNSRVLELSTKGATTEAFQIAMELRAFLHKLDIAPTDLPLTKTGHALSYFSERAQKEAQAAKA
jgi:hypothetical protein